MLNGGAAPRAGPEGSFRCLGIGASGRFGQVRVRASMKVARHLIKAGPKGKVGLLLTALGRDRRPRLTFRGLRAAAVSTRSPLAPRLGREKRAGRLVADHVRSDRGNVAPADEPILHRR